jgi:NitT/TauT family transport system substrate-binding protein
MKESAMPRRVTRRPLLLGALAAPTLARAAGPLRPVTMRLDWIYQGPNCGFIVAKDKGFYADAGLDVEIGPGRGSGSTAQLIGSGAAQFGFADGYVVGNSVARGMDIRMVGGVYRRNPCAVMVLEESDIRTPRDLEGKAIGISPGSGQFQQWPACARGYGIDVSKVRVVSIDPVAGIPALLGGQVQALGGYAQGYVPGIEIRGGKAVRVFPYADAGVTAVSNGIIAQNGLLRSEPALVRAFVAASLKGFLYARANPAEVPVIVRKFSETTDARITAREFELSWANWNTPNTAGRPLGWTSEADWAATVETLKRYGGVTTPLAAEQLFTNEFVPEGAEFIPPA